MLKLIDNTIASDPRIIRFKKAEKQAKVDKEARRKKEKAAAQQAKQDAEKAKKDAVEKAEQDKIEAEKNIVEAARNARKKFTKQCKRLSVSRAFVCACVRARVCVCVRVCHAIPGVGVVHATQWRSDSILVLFFQGDI